MTGSTTNTTDSKSSAATTIPLSNEETNRAAKVSSSNQNPTTEQSIFFVGDPNQIGHHVAPIYGRLNIQIADSHEVWQQAKPGDLCIFYNEFFDEFRNLCRTVRSRGCATLYAVDGILETFLC